MNIGVVERIVVLGPARHTARFAIHREVEYLVVRERFEAVVSLVISHRGPHNAIPQEIRVGVENRPLIFVVESAAIRVVTEQQPDIRVRIHRRVLVSIRNKSGTRTGKPRPLTAITKHPDACRLHRSCDRGGFEKRLRIAAGEHVGGVGDGVIVACVRLEPGERHGVLGGLRRVAGKSRQLIRRSAEIHNARGWNIRTPADDNTGRRAGIQIRPAREVRFDQSVERERKARVSLVVCRLMEFDGERVCACTERRRAQCESRVGVLSRARHLRTRRRIERWEPTGKIG